MHSRLGLWDETKGRWRMEGEEQVPLLLLSSSHFRLLFGGGGESFTHFCCPLITLWIFGKMSPLIGCMARSVGWVGVVSVFATTFMSKRTGSKLCCISFCKKNWVKIMGGLWNPCIACGFLFLISSLSVHGLHPIFFSTQYGRRPNLFYQLPIKTWRIQSRILLHTLLLALTGALAC